MARRITTCLFAAAVLMLVGGSALRAQQCDDFDPCTVNDRCSVDGGCEGTFQTGRSCNDYNPCTINDRCQELAPGEGSCMGDPAPAGHACPCGTCQPVGPFPGAPTLCTGDPADNGKSCDPGLSALNPCIVGTCSIFGAGGLNIANCIPAQKTCPDTDGNPCTDNCNFQNGQCERNAPRCDGVCSQCDPQSGICRTTQLGRSCDDSNPCTAQSSCQNEEILGFALCMAGTPSVIEPTATATPPRSPTAPGATATSTSGTPPTPGACVGDCNNDGSVLVNELVVGVNIVLGNTPLSQCPSFDINGTGSVQINALIQGVNALLNGCA